MLSAGPATELLTISLLVDDSQAAANDIQFIRDGLTKFVERLSGKAEIAIATFGERPTSVIDFTTSTAALKQVAGRMFQKTGSGAYLLDALFDASKGFQKRQDKRPTIVVVTTEGAEFSNRSYQQVLEAIQAGGAAAARPLARPAVGLADRRDAQSQHHDCRGDQPHGRTPAIRC